MAIAGQHDQFQARLARIGKTAGGPAVLLSGVEEVPVQQMKAARKAKRASVSFKNLLGFPISFLIGAVAMVAGHAVSYRFFDQVVKAGDALGFTTLVAADIIMAAVVALIVLVLFGFARKPYILTAVVGFAAIITQEIELARNFPEIWAQIYSPHFVQQSLRAGEMLLPDIATSFSLI
jgi:hypothetical protein